MRPILAAALAGLLVSPGAGLAAPVAERVRGTIEAADAGAMTVRTLDGASATLALTKDTKVVAVARSSLEAIAPGSFVGTANTLDDPPTALEVHIFPESMRGTGEGHRDWDAMPDPQGSARVKSAMTNGTVKAGAAPPPRVKSAMTNGTVAKSTDKSAAAGGAAGGDRTITLSYGDGQTRTIAVTPRTPIVAYEPADPTAIRAGAKVFVIAERDGDRLTAVRAMVGKDGLTPPM